MDGAPTRRALLAAAGSAAGAAAAGCVTDLRSRVAYSPAGQVQLSVESVPADRDPRATAIARTLRDDLQTVGVDASLELLSEEQLLRDALLNHEFDCAVVRVPGHAEPDELRTLLHSQFASEEGWQNPAGFAERSIDRLLEAQRGATGDDRADRLARLQRAVARSVPILPLAAPTYVTAVSPSLGLPDGTLAGGNGTAAAANATDAAPDASGNSSTSGDPANASASDPTTTDPGTGGAPSNATSDAPNSTGAADGGGSATPLSDSLSYLRMEPPGDRLDVAAVVGDVSTNRNVLAVEYRTRDRLLDLVYDRPVRRVGGEYVPWLAADWSVGEAGDAIVRLRPDLRWHDGTELTADDLVFTYRFLRDTALGDTDAPVPAPRFRSQSSLVAEATVEDDRTVRLDLGDASPELVPHALTVPVLPAHTWRDRSELARQYLTRAIVEDVPEPVGSGPLAVVDAAAGGFVSFERFEDHFLRTAEDLPDALAPFAGGPSYAALQANVVPNPGTAIGDVADGAAHVVDGSLHPQSAVEARGMGDVTVVESPGSAYYALLFDVRGSPLSHYGFRTAVASLLDREHLVEDALAGFGVPTVSPLVDSTLVPDGLRYDGDGDPGEFAGEDGELDVDAARSRFRSAGFRYHDEDLLGRQ